MTMLVAFTGSIFRPAESRMSKNGKPFAAATIKTRDGDDVSFVRAVAFSTSAQAELMRLSEGDAVSVQGPLKCELYTPDGGDPRISLSIVADQVLALRKAKTAGEWQSPADGLSRFEAPDESHARTNRPRPRRRSQWRSSAGPLARAQRQGSRDGG